MITQILDRHSAVPPTGSAGWGPPRGRPPAAASRLGRNWLLVTALLLAIYNVAAGALWLVGVRHGAELGRAYRIAEHVAGYAGLVLLAALVVGAAAASVQRHGRRHRAWPA
jgi:cytochrome bd-type quinol oxidase subunit 2